METVQVCVFGMGVTFLLGGEEGLLAQDTVKDEEQDAEGAEEHEGQCGWSPEWEEDDPPGPFHRSQQFESDENDRCQREEGDGNGDEASFVPLFVLLP